MSTSVQLRENSESTSDDSSAGSKVAYKEVNTCTAGKPLSMSGKKRKGLHIDYARGVWGKVETGEPNHAEAWKKKWHSSYRSRERVDADG